MKLPALALIFFWMAVFTFCLTGSYSQGLQNTLPLSCFNNTQPDSLRAALTSARSFPYVKPGYHKLEISTDELLFSNLSFGTGTEKLHTIFTAGSNCSRPTIITYGCGLGTSFTIKHKLGVSATLIIQQMRHTKAGFFRANPMARAYIGLEYTCHPKLRIGVGPTLTIYSSSTLDKYNSDLLSGIPSYRQAEATLPNNLRMWLGAKLSLRFF